MADKLTNTDAPAEDFRVTLARKALAKTETGHDDYGTAVGQVLELRAALAELLAHVDEAARDEAGNDQIDDEAIDERLQLDRIEDLANRTWSVANTAPAFGERLDRIEHGLADLARLQRREVEILADVATSWRDDESAE